MTLDILFLATMQENQVRVKYGDDSGHTTNIQMKKWMAKEWDKPRMASSEVVVQAQEEECRLKERQARVLSTCH